MAQAMAGEAARALQFCQGGLHRRLKPPWAGCEPRPNGTGRPKSALSGYAEIAKSKCARLYVDKTPDAMTACFAGI